MKHFKCSITGCDLEYSTKYNLNRHIRVQHIGVRYTCDECGQQLSSAQNLQDHLYVHTGEKPYLCKVAGCGKRYRQVSQLSVHKRKHLKTLNSINLLHVHTEEKPYLCKVKGCGKRYNKISQLSAHKRNHFRSFVPLKIFFGDLKIKIFLDGTPKAYEIPSGPYNLENITLPLISGHYKLEDIKLPPISC